MAASLIIAFIGGRAGTFHYYRLAYFSSALLHVVVVRSIRSVVEPSWTMPPSPALHPSVDVVVVVVEMGRTGYSL